MIQLCNSESKISNITEKRDVSETSGTPKSSILVGFSINYIYYTPSILGVPLFLEPPKKMVSFGSPSYLATLAPVAARKPQGGTLVKLTYHNQTNVTTPKAPWDVMGCQNHLF